MRELPIDSKSAVEWLDRRDPERPVFYASVDIRRGAGRICPIDVNLFPAGFNNLCKTDAEDTPGKLKAAFERRGVRAGAGVGVIAESHTRNPYYAEHLHALVGLIRKAGYRAEISCPECAEDVTVRSVSGETLTMLPILRLDRKIIFGADFVPDFLLVNNDFASGIPPGLVRPLQTMEPSPTLGWCNRRKHDFFSHYERIAKEFCRDLGTDSRLIVPKSLFVGDVNFKTRAGFDQLAEAVESVLAAARAWHDEMEISERPVAVIKSNHGTYGMAVMSVSSVDEVRQMNRKTVNKMQIGKGKIQTREVLVQEGIPTEDAVDGCPAEPVVYFLDGRPIGAFYRHHCERENTYNLNVSGMAFKPICLHDDPEAKDVPLQTLLAVTRLAVLAAAEETAAAAKGAKGDGG
ncbi:glutamate--cysteine ligase [bacterium]|nr:glutamate--cysteine ligase [bacterium]